MAYQTENITARLKTKPVQYNQDCRPNDPGIYQQFDEEFKDRTVYDIWEMSMPNSLGWLGIIDDDGETVVEGEFKTYTHTGPYSELMEACKDIARRHTDLTEFYCLYLNSPLQVAAKDLQTKIVWH